MPEDRIPDIPDEIIVYTLPAPPGTTDPYDRLRGGYDETSTPAHGGGRSRLAVDKLQQHINVFVVQIGSILADTPHKVGGFRLDTVEVSAGITSSGEIALLGFGGTKIEIEGTLRFEFKRAE